MTNRDRINQLSNEKLASYLSAVACRNCVIKDCKGNFRGSCSNTIKEWLDSEVTELKKGQIVKDINTNELFLVLSIDDSGVTCMNQKFNEVKIGIDYINDYVLHDELDILDFTRWVVSEVTE